MGDQSSFGFGDEMSADGSARVISLQKLCTEISRSLAKIGTVTVEGEVVKPVTRPSGWTYFTLADRAASIQVACPAHRAGRCLVSDGERVAVTGSPELVARRGQLHLVAWEIQPVGDGAIARAVERIRATLTAEGLIGRPARPLPVLPRLVGVVCGAKAAVRADIEAVVAARFPGYPVVFEEVPITGPGAADAIIEAMRRLVSSRHVGAGAEVVILARGGGDPATFLPFSDEALCRAVAASPVPVVAAIGHEGDRPLCDELADLRCGTPSLAAVAVIPDEEDLRSCLDALASHARANLGTKVGGLGEYLGSLDPRGVLAHRFEMLELALAAARPDGMIDSRFGTASDRLGRIDLGSPVRTRLDLSGSVLQGLQSTLVALNPERILERGYAIVFKGAGNVDTKPGGPDRPSAVRSPKEVAPGEMLNVKVAGGSFEVVVG